ncbi:hypothetical protein VHEMI01501 [[Torrubiella] hemipterigena]|uniref:Tat pathway signal sequence n=1 Tax=[Torrubiella] hemipterigena TaxID=1531966 RepID=A0A0A1ST79_9HYPO|nr:hypothetical protein VHEMI01501 [[Torrubiella] hemipterigena]
MGYSRVPTQPACDCERCLSQHDQLKNIDRRISILASLIASFVLNAVLVAYFWFAPTRHAPVTAEAAQFLYSPAQTALKYTTRVFDSAFGIQTTAYQGRPNEANDQLWTELYNFGITRISADEARPMVNKTLPIPGQSDHYLISLSVFHQLHCLNRVRKGLYGEVDWSDVSEHSGITHLDHCIDVIRQSLMCNADVTPLTFTRDSRDGVAREVAEVIHQCRDFDAIRDWAATRAMPGMWDTTKVVTDDPLGWGDYHVDY